MNNLTGGAIGGSGAAPRDKHGELLFYDNDELPDNFYEEDETDPVLVNNKLLDKFELNLIL